MIQPFVFQIFFLRTQNKIELFDVGAIKSILKIYAAYIALVPVRAFDALAF